ncbi:putative methyltransferase NSUN7 isoform X2 [Tachyglossus aculeatus]|uniref:putative methyltransferase NSUN7 isoform X2 n=1 Tax=Tachyglossus aculeatus TaxID=9261 RepID=UPI0018F3DF80|nr:putative methyltransferase NSUN7 isoform X2 [Tachyglossus aculeatus]
MHNATRRSGEGVAGEMAAVGPPALAEAQGSGQEQGASGLGQRSGHQDSVYVKAAEIFHNIRTEKPAGNSRINYGNQPLHTFPDFRNGKSQHWAYELAFSTLKYQDILENILLDSCFYPTVPLPADLTSLVVVMLYDFQDRKFQARLISDNEEPIAEVQEVENHLSSFKTKLAAALARCRIKHDALSIDSILPEMVRKQEQRASTLPLYVWINSCKTSPEDIYIILKKEGFTKVNSVTEFVGKSFCVDQHCPDVIVFPSYLKSELLNIDLFTEYKLLFQDKSRSLAVHSVKALLNMDDDILLVNMGSWLTVAHMSVLTNQSSSKVFVCGIKSQGKEVELKNLYTNIGCENIELLRENFTALEPKDQRLQKVKVILLLPRCSGLGVSNPVEFILSEHEVNKAQAIVYCTCSVYPEENEVVIKKALEFRAEGSKIQPYRLSPPVLPLCSVSEIQSSASKFFKMEPSDITNGCFLAVLTREKDPAETVSVKDILARAAAKGLLDGIELTKSPRREKKKKSKTSLPKTCGSSTGSQLKITEFLNRGPTLGSEAPAAKAGGPGPQKSGSTRNFSQVPKFSKPSTDPPAVQSSLSAPIRASERSRLEGKMVVLKPVEIVLPPVLLPFSSPQGKAPTPHCYYRWVRTSGHNLLTSSGSKKLEKAKEPGTAVRHPRPWL